MQIEKKINLRNNNYYVIIDVEYKKDKYGYPSLCLKNFKDDYWDGGDFNVLIDKIEKNYTCEKAEFYDENIPYMADVLYIYDRIPFLSGIKEVYVSNNNSLPYSTTYTSVEEIKEYIELFHTKMTYMNANPDFKLYSESTWKI